MSNKRTYSLALAAVAATISLAALAAGASAGTTGDGYLEPQPALQPLDGKTEPQPPEHTREPQPQPPAPEPQPGPTSPDEEERKLVLCECDELEVDARPENAYWQNRNGRRGQSIIFRGTLTCEPGDIDLCWSQFTIRKKSATGEIRTPLGRSRILNQPIRCDGPCGKKITVERKLWIVIEGRRPVDVELEVEKGPCGDQGPSRAVFTFHFKHGRLASIERSPWEPIPTP